MRGYRPFTTDEIRKYAVVGGVLDNIPPEHQELVGKAILETLKLIEDRVESNGESGPPLQCQIGWEKIAVLSIVYGTEFLAPRSPTKPSRKRPR